MNQTVWNELQAFFQAMQTEPVDTKQLGISRRKEDVLNALKDSYKLE